MQHPRREQGERGAAALSLLTLAVILALCLLLFVAIPLTRAADAKAKSSSAADAAALAAVQYVERDVRSLLTSGLFNGTWPDSFGYGPHSAATQYAQLNDSELTDFTAPTLANGWTAWARVKGRTVDGEIFYSEATAKLDLPGCSVRTEDPPEPEPEPEDDEDEEGEGEDGEDSDEPEEEPTVKRTISCDGLADLELDIPLSDLDGGLLTQPMPSWFTTGLAGLIDAKLTR